MIEILLQISEDQLAVMGALGAGLLVGTALAVIIPEGFHAFQTAQHDTGVHCTASHTDLHHFGHACTACMYFIDLVLWLYKLRFL